MAQFSLDPAPTRAEISTVARLVLEKKEKLGFRTNEQVAEAIGLQASELSRLIHAYTERKWGFARLSKIANWLGMDIDRILGRPEGTTNVMLAGGKRPNSVPLLKADRVLVSRSMVMELAKQVAAERERFNTLLAREVGAHKAEAVRSLADNYIDRITELRAQIAF